MIEYNELITFDQPAIQEVASVDALNTSNLLMYKTICTADADGKSAEELATTGANWVDVRDLGNSRSHYTRSYTEHCNL